eukprot:TRINITY_DN27582_c0_g1_i1.p1 TRINITY_DN27582_c0_g1~~TRINITY_DN27582_c0_g1_i1.p1  ORF type:complete len:1035 (-),score=242.32 TRINITY_DN27582_c0_g1_i1:75-3179(-)
MQSYRFSNLLGATYKGGSVRFTPDGNVLLSPVGNRISAVDLIQGRSATLDPENREDVSVLALTNDARLLLSIDVKGHALLINFVRCAILTRINFKGPVSTAKWSPDNQWLIVGRGRHVQVWRTPTLELGWQFVPHQTFGGHHDDVVDLAWSPNSLFFTSCSKDGSVRLQSVNPMHGFEKMALLEHRSPVRASFFSADMRYIFSLSRDGVLVSLRFDPKDARGKQVEETRDRPLYCQDGKWVVESKAFCNQPGSNKVTRCDFDAKSNLLAVGFSMGVFMLFEMPSLQALHTLSLGRDPLDSIALGANGDWLAVGSAAVGQLLVWEWRSETYVLKQQGHHWGVRCVAFSPSGAQSFRREKTLSSAEGRPEDKSSTLGGRLLATGGYDGKVKLFNAQSGLCFVTFAEHTAPVSAVCFTPQGNAVVSASRDGSVRAYDLLRYRNFRTFASPDGLCQFSSVTVDAGGEIVAASATGGKYAIYVWSIQTGNILEVLTGHTSHVQSLFFSPSAKNPGQLVSGSWDSTLCVWDLYAGTKGGAAETLQCPSSVLSVAFDPRGNDMCAAACLSGQVLFWNVVTAQNLGSIDGLRDIQSGRQWHDMFAATHMRGLAPGKGLKKKKNASDGLHLNQHFNAIAYARSGELLLCSSQNSPFVSLYDTTAYSLAARVTLTTNRSLSGVQVMLNSKFMTEAGAAIQSFDLSDSEADDAEAERARSRRRQAEALPGVSVGEGKDAYTEKELRVWDVAFSSDSQQFAVATTHGVFVYAQETGLGTPGGSAGVYGGEVSRFVPQMLTKAVSAPAVLKALEAKDLSKAMILALALNDYGLLRKVYESVPVKSIPVVIASIGAPLLPALLWFLSLELRPAAGTPHFQFHVNWVTALIDLHFQTLMELTAGKTSSRTGSSLESAAAQKSDVAALCLQLLVELSQRHAMISKTFENNTYLLRYLGSAPSAEEAEEAAAAAAAASKEAKKGGKKKLALEAAKEVAKNEEADGEEDDDDWAGNWDGDDEDAVLQTKKSKRQDESKNAAEGRKKKKRKAA